MTGNYPYLFRSVLRTQVAVRRAIHIGLLTTAFSLLLMLFLPTSSPALTAAPSQTQENLASLVAPVSGASPRGQGLEHLYFPILQDIPDQVVWISPDEKGTESVAWGDYDGDGDLDLAVGNDSQVNQVYRNDGGGTFSPFDLTTDGKRTSSVAWGDYDGDGDLDLAVGNYGNIGIGDVNQVYRNDGGGTFSPFDLDTDARSTYSVAWGDYDGDGDLDLAVGNGGSQINQVYRNDGEGTFSPFDLGTDARSTYSVAWGDYDGDGDLDLAVGNSGVNQVYRNDGGGTFSPFDLGTDAKQTTSVAWGDYDGDGDLDLAAGNGDQANQVYRNDGGGTFSPFDLDTDARSTYSVAWGDYDGDGDLDLAVGNSGYQINQVYHNDGGGTFSPFDLGTDAKQTTSVAWGDYDSDGDLDLAIGNDYQVNQVYHNDGKGAFSPFDLDTDARATWSVAWGDYDGDGDLDLAVGNGSSQANQVYRNDGGETFSPFDLDTEARATLGVAWGDYDGDGDLDLAVGNIDQVNQVYRNEGGGAFSPFDLGTEAKQTTSVAWGDYDGDGDLDLAVGNHDQANQVYRNDGGGTFSPFDLDTDARATYSVAWGDYDGDGDLDLAVGNYGSVSISDVNQVYRNDGGGAFSPFDLSPNEKRTYSMAWGDYDGDGDLDLAVGNMGQVNQIYRNNGGGVFSPFNLGPDTRSTYSVAWGDYDGDGDLDLAVGNDYQVNQIYRNDGGGTFSPFDLGTDGKKTSSVAWGDYDGDGDLDLAVGNHDQANQVYHNARQGLEPMLPDNVPYISVGQPANLAAANFCAISGYLDSRYIRFPYTLFDPEGNLMGGVSAWYSFEGGGAWRPAVAATDTVTTHLATLASASITQPLSITDNGTSGSTLNFERHDLRVQNLELSLTLVHTQASQLAAALWAEWPPPTGTHVLLFDGVGGDTPGFANLTLSDWARRIISSTSYTMPIGGRYRPAEPLAGLDGMPLDWPLTLVITDSVADGEGTLTRWAVRNARQYTYAWDTWASGFFGQSDNVVVRLVAYPQPITPATSGTYRYPNSSPGPFQHTFAAATTFPFRVRGTQVRVYSETIHISNTVANALVYRLPEGQFTGGFPLVDGSGTPLRTDHQGYLQGRGTIAISDTLFALLPITHTDTYTVYHTNATPTETGLRGHTVTQPGVQTITVTAEHPLILFNLDISLEWDARHDILFLEQLEFDLQRASEFLYDWTNGQAALGRVTLYHDREMWSDAHVRIYASNRLRPNATLGGIVSTVISDPLKSDITYTPGQVRMAAVWNRYGESSGSLGEDWPRTLAHELGHYALFLDDAYLGLDEDGLLIPVDTCTGTAMADPYRDDYGEFHLDAGWLPNCEDTLAQQTVGRSDWATIHALYPWLTATTVLSGPTGLPLAVTQIQVVEPVTSTTTLDVPIFYLSQDGARIQPGLRARAIMFQPDRGRLIDLGRATLDQVTAHGTRPGDRVCLYELEQERLGCTDITLGDTQLALHAHPGWRPDVIVTPITSRTVNISVTVDSVSAPLHARLYPLSGPASEEITLELVTSGHYSGTFDDLAKPAVAAYVHIWVDEDEPRREIVTDYALGGNPAHMGSRDAHMGSRDAHMGSRDAPGMSADGKAILFGETLVFTRGTFVSLQAATILPSPPPWATVVGQGYRLLMSADAPSLDGTSLRFQYSGQDVPPGEEHLLKLYYWDGTEWHQLEDTKLDTYFNTAVAPTQGEGLYALMSSLEIPLYGVGWNNFAYPVQGTRPVTEALRSIEGYYNIVYSHVPTDTIDPWKVHGAGVPDWVSDLKVFRFGQGYWINVTQPITLLLKGNADLSAQADSSFLYPPATYYGPVPDNIGFTPTAGMTVTAWINDNLCGQAQTRDIDGEVWFVIDVLANDWGQAADCGAPGRMVTFEVETRGTIALTAQIYTALWNNDRVWALPGPRIYLPLVIRLYTTP